MKIIKNINNNFAYAIDRDGNYLIVSGRGIGFCNVPRTISDMSLINRTYYDVDEMYVSMINDIPEEIIEISGMIIDKARTLIDNPINSNIVFTLADHIHFCIQRHHKNMNIKLPIIYDIQHLFEKEMLIGEYGLNLIKERLAVFLPKEEAAYIALHLINAEEKEKNVGITDDKIINDIVIIVENCYMIKIDKDTFNYSRFITHIHYLLKRGKINQFIESDNDKLHKMVKKHYIKSSECSEKVSQYLKNKLGFELNNEEKLYLMLHINRLCTREDCNQ